MWDSRRVLRKGPSMLQTPFVTQAGMGSSVWSSFACSAMTCPTGAAQACGGPVPDAVQTMGTGALYSSYWDGTRALT